MNYWFLHTLSTGEIYGSPYLGTAEEWTNIPAGCEALGPFPQDSALPEVVDAFSNPQYYTVQSGKLVQKTSYADQLLADTKAAKIAELDQMCNQTILSGFTSLALGQEYHYPFDEEAQRNLTGALTLLNADPTLTTVEFKVLDIGKFVDHTRDQFLQVCKDAFAFKSSMIKKYHDLKDQVNAATTVDEVNAIVW